MRKPTKPPGLGAAGSKLWTAVVDAYELDPRETSLLAHACRQSDDVAMLEKLLSTDGPVVEGSQGQPRLSAVVTELRNSRLAVGKLLGELDLPESGKAVSVQSRRAAQRRWGA